MIIADVEDLPLAAQIECRTQGAFDRVINIGKAASLRPVTVHGERLIVNCLTHEVGHDRAVAAGVEPWSVRIEIAHDGHPQSVLGMSKGEMFIDCLCR